MKRGEIYFANLDPSIGAEIKKKRPVIIVSNNANNNAGSTITVVPITSNTHKIYPFEVLLEIKDTGLTKRSKAQPHQIKTISKMRLENRKAGFVNKEAISRIDSAIKLHLDF